MPLYEFECSNGHRTEQMRSLSEFVESITCPECQKKNCTSRRRAVLIPSNTGAPRLVKGVGGFYSPTTPE
jgi:putative FmdB family regulatory protein